MPPTVITVGQEEAGRAGGTYPVTDVTQVREEGRGERE